MSDYNTAYKYAKEKHEGQKRKFSGLPYITHPEAVVQSLRDCGYSEDVQIVGILHDVIEDTDAEYIDLINLGFSEHIIDAVHDLTKICGETYLESILKIKNNLKNTISKVVKEHDIKHNMSDLKNGTLKDKYRMALYILASK